ncbi:sensor histidine kinase [Aquabacter spiritensis]|nr:HAMP domain-containing sensor histidine kinase [Aquabacter spiritensis]
MDRPFEPAARGATPTLTAPALRSGFRRLPLLAGTACAAALVLGVAGTALASPVLTGFAGLFGGAGLAGLLAGRVAARLERTARRADARAATARAALAQAEARNLAKSRFLAEMSHELRTPLNAVIGFSEMMAHEVFGPHGAPVYGDYARDIHESGRHLLALADDLLDLARIETGHRELLETPVRLDDLVQDCGNMMRLAAAARSVTLSATADGPTPRLWADERAVRQMTLNLLGNAVKFTPKGGAVRVFAALDASGSPLLVVEDTGPGLKDAELPLDISARHRESTLDPATGRGAGLGLAIVDALADLHGAQLTLTARPGGGTRAAIAFPASRLLPDAVPSAEDGVGSADAAAQQDEHHRKRQNRPEYEADDQPGRDASRLIAFSQSHAEVPHRAT